MMVRDVVMFAETLFEVAMLHAWLIGGAILGRRWFPHERGWLFGLFVTFFLLGIAWFIANILPVNRD